MYGFLSIGEPRLLPTAPDRCGPCPGCCLRSVKPVDCGVSRSALHQRHLVQPGRRKRDQRPLFGLNVEVAPLILFGMKSKDPAAECAGRVYLSGAVEKHDDGDSTSGCAGPGGNDRVIAMLPVEPAGVVAQKADSLSGAQRQGKKTGRLGTLGVQPLLDAVERSRVHIDIRNPPHVLLQVETPGQHLSCFLPAGVHGPADAETGRLVQKAVNRLDHIGLRAARHGRDQCAAVEPEAGGQPQFGPSPTLPG